MGNEASDMDDGLTRTHIDTGTSTHVVRQGCSGSTSGQRLADGKVHVKSMASTKAPVG